MGVFFIRRAHRIVALEKNWRRRPPRIRRLLAKYDRPWRERREFRREALRGSLVILLVWVAFIVAVALTGPRS